jgi:hypothetical protein
MSVNNYNTLLNQFVNTIPNKYYMFVVTKCCGYQEMVIVLKNAKIKDLQQTFLETVGKVLYDTVYFKNKNYNNSEEKFYLKYQPALQHVSDFIRNLSIVYTVDECPYSVYQLYYDVNCCCHSADIPNTNNCLEPLQIPHQIDIDSLRPPVLQRNTTLPRFQSQKNSILSSSVSEEETVTSSSNAFMNDLDYIV